MPSFCHFEILLSNESWNFIIQTTQRRYREYYKTVDHRGSGSADFQKREYISDFTSKVHRTKASQKSKCHRSFQYLEAIEGLIMLSCLEGRYAPKKMRRTCQSIPSMHAKRELTAFFFTLLTCLTIFQLVPKSKDSDGK